MNDWHDTETRSENSDTESKASFTQLADRILSESQPAERLNLSFEGENTDFVRLTQGRIRQPGHVRQGYVTLRLAKENKSAEARVALSGRSDDDTGPLCKVLEALRAQLPFLPEDPYLHFPTDEASSEDEEVNRLPPAAHMVRDILDAAAGQDLVGILSSGSIFAGFASTNGQRNWFARHPVHVDFSLQLTGDRAVKDAYAGTAWDASAFALQCQRMKTELALLDQKPRRISPGEYRVYLAPAALDEIFQVLAWGGAFGLSAWNTKESCLIRLQDERETLSSQVEILEHTAAGFGPNFNAGGWRKPSFVTLVSDGRRHHSLVSPRTALEYQVEHTGAEPDEEPCALQMRAGSLAEADILRSLDTGLYISNLWYLNHSDRQSCRLTGMTRFGTFWVEDGEIVSPLEVMRFDDSLFRMLGTELEALTEHRRRFMDTRSYGARSTKSSLLPGALLRSLSFTL